MVFLTGLQPLKKQQIEIISLLQMDQGLKFGTLVKCQRKKLSIGIKLAIVSFQTQRELVIVPLCIIVILMPGTCNQLQIHIGYQIHIAIMKTEHMKKFQELVTLVFNYPNVN